MYVVGDGLRKMEEVTQGFNNMCTVVGILCPLWRSWPDIDGPRCCGEKSRDDTRLRSTESVLDERLKDIHVQLMNDVHGPKYIFSEFMDLSDINYKFIDLKMHFKNLWTYVSKVY